MVVRHQLDHMFNPRSVAVIGASGTFGKWGFNIFSRVLSTRGRRDVYAVNDRETEVLGVNAYGSISDVPGPVDVAVITVPFQALPKVMSDCAQKKVRVAVIISSGFAETGAEGEGIEREVARIARLAGIRFVGPNCLGVFDAYSGFCTLGFLPPVRKGNVALVSQSGNSGQSVLNYGLQMGLGFSKFVSSGNEADLHFEDYLEYLAQDERTEIILGHVEGLREGRRFLELARGIARRKPIVIMKTGRTDVGTKAARSHSAALAGSEVVLDAAFRQCGVIRVDEIGELVDVAVALLGQPLPRGRRVGVLSMGGGMAVTSADALRREGLELPPLSPTTIDRLNSILSTRWSHGNPVDPAGDVVSYHCLWPMIEDDNLDAIVVIGGIGMASGFSRWAPPSMKRDVGQATKYLDALEIENVEKTIELMRRCHKPVIFTMAVTGAPAKGKVARMLNRSHLNLYSTPERAARVLSCLVKYSEYLRRTAESHS